MGWALTINLNARKLPHFENSFAGPILSLVAESAPPHGGLGAHAAAAGRLMTS